MKIKYALTEKQYELLLSILEETREANRKEVGGERLVRAIVSLEKTFKTQHNALIDVENRKYNGGA